MLSASEIALFSLTRIQLKKFKEHSLPIFRRIRVLLQDPIGLLITILFFNEIVNIALGAIITTSIIENIASPLWLLDLGIPNWLIQTFLSIIMTTPLVMLLGDLTPKVVATRANQFVISLFLPVLYTFYRVMKPALTFVRLFFPQTASKEIHHLREDDFMHLAEEHAETGHLHETELELIKNVFQMDDTLVDSLATPIRSVLSVPAHFTLREAAALTFKERAFSRIPIHDKNKDDIVGVLHTKDLIVIKVNPSVTNDSVMSIAKEPLIISHQTSLDVLFRKMKSKKVQTAFIKNSAGKITGMVSIQDIIETLIKDAFDEDLGGQP